ncbi:hypothetical protein NIES3806_21620 [Microcystis aeruginosa NIES-3806]|uniref:hypothetical protein n=1 Tax=Microcystis aeruginosa TaxID=1126 RepID=UPI00130BA39E|nr:hypothetical protein [Microcystis aeruginosa]GCL54819.1 hypothetical protein NIES3806_21620 [Microcystis aeruginosa NIES-3806]
MTTIHIHEFSTGILVDGTGGAGEWRSRGFSGEYMNSTLAEIPRPVQLAIKNREFAVSEGASSQNPAIIGREVEYHGEAWSVIAVVTRGMDERGRGASLYRYFLCQERGKLTDLVSWYMKNGMPTFNPSDHKQVDWFTEYDDTGTQINDYIPHELDGIWEGKTPIIITQKQPPYTALIIHKIASKTDPAKYNELISWACNVEALEKPNRFLVIHPASKKAEETIRATINSIPQLPPAIPEEPLIRTAIKNSCRTGNFQENLAPIENALNNPKIQQDYTTFWNSIFEGQGSKDAYEQQIYDDFKVRLLTLQAIICPEKLPDFVAWIMKKEKDYYPICQRFQGEIVKAITQPNSLIFNQVKQGINILILHIIKQPDLIDATAKLLLDEVGLWGGIYKSYTSVGLRQDLKKKAGYLSTETEGLKEKEFYVLNDARWQEIIDDLRKVWNPRFYPDQTTQKYIHLARLFDKLEVPSEEQYKGSSLTVFFYHLTQEKIPSDVYKRHKLREDKDYNFGIQVKRDIPWYEPVFKFFENYSSSNFKGGIPSVIITFVVFSIVFTLGGFFFQRLLNLANLSVPGLPGGSNNSESPIIKKAIGSFPKTKESLMQIKSDLMKTTRADNSKSNPQENEIDEAISKILDPTYSSNAGNSSTSNNYLNLKTIDKDKDKWIQAIIYYQLYKVTPSNSDDIDGIIDKDGTTYQALKCNLLQNMQLQATQATADNCKKLGFSKVKVAKTPASSSTPAPTPTTTEEEAIRKAVPEFDKPQKTKYSLETLVKELDEAFSVSSSYNVINVLDPNNEFGIYPSRMTEPADKEAWVKAILQYQESLKSRLKKEQSINIDVDGVINYERNTYNLLKCDVAAQLGETLSDKPAICGKVKPIIDSSTPPPG